MVSWWASLNAVHSVVPFGSGFFVVGGTTNYPDSHTDKLLFYNTVTDSWADLTPQVPAHIRLNAASQVCGIIGTKLYVRTLLRCPLELPHLRRLPSFSPSPSAYPPPPAPSRIVEST